MILLQLRLIAAATYPAQNSVEHTVSKAVGKRTGISPRIVRHLGCHSSVFF